MQGFGKIIETKILVEKLPPLSHCHFDQREKSSGVPEISAPAKIPRSARNDNRGILKNLHFQKKPQKPYTTSGLRFSFKHNLE
jgi:hypothetical protein